MKHWIIVAGVLLAVLIVLTLVLLKPADTTPLQSAQPMTTPVTPPVTPAHRVDTNDQPLTVAIPQDPDDIQKVSQKINQEQKAAQQIIEDQVVILPIEGTIRTRPAFVSDMEWNMLQSVAHTNANPDQELNHLVNLLRFNKMIEQYQTPNPTLTPANKRKLASQILAELPNHINSGDIDRSDARQLKDQLSRDAQPQQSTP
jgi:hypothetical protein